jgi:DNA-nicking Smr family endonuclease
VKKGRHEAQARDDLFSRAARDVVPISRQPHRALPHARRPVRPSATRTSARCSASSRGSPSTDDDIEIEDDGCSCARAAARHPAQAPAHALGDPGHLDLHGLTADEAVAQTAAFLAECKRLGLRCVRIVHGKGLRSPGREPVLKRRIRKLLTRRDEVLAFVEPRAIHGGGGAVVVLLEA